VVIYKTVKLLYIFIMKNNVLFLTLIVCVVFIFSCQRNERTQAPQVEASVELEPMVASTITNPGHALRVNAGFYSLSGDDTGDETTRTRWAAGMSLGERLLTGETRQMTFDADGRIFDFIAVRRENGNEGYALIGQVAAGGSLAVVIDERCNLFRSPRTVDVSGVILSRGTVIVYYPETESDGFVEIRGFDPERQQNIASNNNFVRLSSLSLRNSDIQSSILLQTALSLRENENIRRDALLEAAFLDFPDSIFNTEIFEIMHPNIESIIPDDQEYGTEFIQQAEQM
jgi:hypothetical protein